MVGLVEVALEDIHAPSCVFADQVVMVLALVVSQRNVVAVLVVTLELVGSLRGIVRPWVGDRVVELVLPHMAWVPSVPSAVLQ